MTEAKRFETLNKLFGDRAAKAAHQFAGGGPAGYAAIEQRMQKAAAVQEKYNMLMKTFWGHWDRIVALFQRFSIGMGKLILPALGSMLSLVERIANVFETIAAIDPTAFKEMLKATVPGVGMIDRAGKFWGAVNNVNDFGGFLGKYVGKGIKQVRTPHSIVHSIGGFFGRYIGKGINGLFGSQKVAAQGPRAQPVEGVDFSRYPRQKMRSDTEFSEKFSARRYMLGAIPGVSAGGPSQTVSAPRVEALLEMIYTKLPSDNTAEPVEED